MTDLTEREREIIEAIKEADPTQINNDYIAKKVYLSVGTLKHHLGSIYKKTETKNMTGLILKIMRGDL